jgi:hypothetical protein
LDFIGECGLDKGDTDVVWDFRRYIILMNFLRFVPKINVQMRVVAFVVIRSAPAEIGEGDIVFARR